MLDAFMPNEPLIPVYGRGPLPVPIVPAIPARVPGSVHDDLLAAGLIPDWNDGMQSLHSEWVNNRHWRYRRTITVPPGWGGKSIVLCADGLDDSGSILIDGRHVASFEGALKRHEVDLTAQLVPGESAELSIIFDPSPRIAGNVGYTSRIERLKPRFGYGWDWCAPLVNIGIWDAISLQAKSQVRLRNLVVTADLNETRRVGSLKVVGKLEGEAASEMIRVTVVDPAGVMVMQHVEAGQAHFELHVSVPNVQPWWPAGMGEQHLYAVAIELMRDGRVRQVEQRTIGFRRVRWLPNDKGPEGAFAYACQVNGQSVFLKGVNWVPLSPFYGSPAREEYEVRLRQYLAMNANILRVWGGGPLERHDFYDLCDRVGLMVWQEFPLSSSLIDNWPSESPDVIDQLCEVATDYLQRRAHHASLIMWCGGNELQGGVDGGKTGEGKPVGLSHPCMACLEKLLQEHDAGRLFLPTSASGPRFTFKDETCGLGMHHDVHGPWEVQPRGTVASYWNKDDALLRSEVGVPGAARASAIRRGAGKLAHWPPDRQTPYWAHHAKQWLPMEAMQREFGPWDRTDGSQLPDLVRCSQFAQADSYRYAVEACRRRAFACSGVLIWMGHDIYRMPCNNSVIEHDGVPKMAYYALKNAMAPLHVSARLESSIVPESRIIQAQFFLHDDRQQLSRETHWCVRLFDVSGRCLNEASGVTSGQRGPRAIKLGEIHWTSPATDENVLILRCELVGQHAQSHSDYLITQDGSVHSLAPLRQIEKTSVRVELDSHDQMRLHNVGSTAAIQIWPAEASDWVPVDPWPMIMLPNEAAVVRIKRLGDASESPRLELNGMNLVSEVDCTAGSSIEPMLELHLPALSAAPLDKARRVVR
ncbi:MAG TPA: glycoside hydrolase family 2 TIM barrel-domain containing protein [Roseimicrobium sp.]|nr:glycoside hydrolase family 2 TIM barrel-domain containing protein [Roseimicrobium sp.]